MLVLNFGNLHYMMAVRENMVITIETKIIEKDKNTLSSLCFEFSLKMK